MPDSDTKEATFRVMLTAKVWWKGKDITMMQIDQANVGTLPGDNLTHAGKNLLKRNGEMLMEHALICALRIAQAKTKAEKDELGRQFFNDATSPSTAKLVEDALTEPVIADKKPEGE